MVLLLAQAALKPLRPSRNKSVVTPIVLLGLLDQNCRLLRQARHVREARRTATRTPAHEALFRFPVDRLRTDVAFLPLRVVRALLDRNRDGLLTFLVGVVLFRVAAAVNLLKDLLVAAAPVVVLACGVAISGFAPHTARGVVGQWGGAGGAAWEDHLYLGSGELAEARRSITRRKFGFGQFRRVSLRARRSSSRS